jgi:hypothetical protein
LNNEIGIDDSNMISLKPGYPESIPQQHLFSLIWGALNPSEGGIRGIGIRVKEVCQSQAKA